MSVIPNPPPYTSKTPDDAFGRRRGLGYQPCLYFVDEDGKAKPWSYDVEYHAASDEAAVEESGDDLDQGW